MKARGGAECELNYGSEVTSLTLRIGEQPVELKGTPSRSSETRFRKAITDNTVTGVTTADGAAHKVRRSALLVWTAVHCHVSYALSTALTSSQGGYRGGLRRR